MYVAEMTTYLRCAKSHSTGLAVSAAELGITNLTEPQPTGNRGHCDSARPTPTCVCGKQHWYTDCSILNPRHPGRPKTYQPAAEAVRKVEEARKDPRINKQVNTALERWAARQPQSTGTLRVDDGKAPANNTTFVSTGLSLVSLDDCNDRYDRDDRDVYDDRDVREGHDGHDNRDGYDHREDRDDRDDDVITIDSRAEPAGLLTVLAVEDTNQTELLNRWIVAPGSNTHVISTEAW
jgi:hypothetical protein